jgi:hypothetical protein
MLCHAKSIKNNKQNTEATFEVQATTADVECLIGVRLGDCRGFMVTEISEKFSF